MRIPFGRASTRLGSLLGSDSVAIRQSLVALVIAALASLIAGVTLAGSTSTLEDLPGLLLLVPAATALRGNVFGALGSRLGTSIHTGTFHLSARTDTLMGQNLVGALVLSAGGSAILAFLARGVSLGFGISPTLSLAEYFVVSILGGMMASVVVLSMTVALAAGSVRYEWDLDNVTAPLVSASGDMVTLPALMVAAKLIGHDAASLVAAIVLGLLSVGAVVAGLRSGLPDLVRILQESLPVLTAAALMSLIAGVTVEGQVDSFLDLPALLVLLPGFLAIAGALGGILSSRLATKFHLGLIEPRPIPSKNVVEDVRTIFLLSLPGFAFTGVVADVGSLAFGFESPGLAQLIGVAAFAGVIATVFVVVIAYIGTMFAVRMGVDPDTYGIPLVSSSLDFVGAFAFVFAIAAIGVA